MIEKKNMLLVTSDAQLQEMIQKRLKETYHIEVMGVQDAEKVQAHLKKSAGQIHVVVTDERLSEKDGLFVLPETVSEAYRQGLPVVLLIEREQEGAVQTALQQGAAEVLAKPVDADRLADSVDNVVKIYSSRLYRELAKRTRREQQRYRIVLEQSKTYVIEVDYNKGQVYIDPMLYNVFNMEKIKIQGAQMPDFRPVVYLPDLETVRRTVAHDDFGPAKETRSADVRLRTLTHYFEWFHLTTCVFRSEAGHKERMIITLCNIHEDMMNRKRLEYMATRDMLTKIYNRESFTENTVNMFRNHPEKKYVMIRMDIDRFRMLGQLYGPEVGDRILCFLAVKLQESVEGFEVGTYCRLNSDVFAACLPYDRAQVNKLIEYIQQEASTYPVDYPFVVKFGLYVIDDMKQPINTMLDRAAQAQKTIKGSVLRHEAYYDDKLKEQDNMEQMILAEMDTALEQGQFQVYLQPKCRMDTRKLVGSEVLVRWIHPERGMISPAAFIPLFERNGFITHLDRYVWEETCKLIRSWLDKGLPVKPVSVNISRINLYSAGLKDFIVGLVEKYRIPPELLELELTETSFASDEMLLRKLSKELQKAGFRILMDDFGSGYSSLNSLKDLNIDQIKLDLRFLIASDNDDKGGSIMSSIIRMAKMLGLSVVAEGVETAEQAAFLLSVNCSVGQGFYFYRPMPWAEFEKLMEEQSDEENEEQIQYIDAMDYRALLSSESVAVRLLNLLTEGVCIMEYSRGGKMELIRYNDAFAETMQCSREMLEQNASDMMMFILDECKPRVLEHFNEEHDPTIVDTEELCISVDGKEIWLRIKARLLSVQQDNWLFLLCVVDISKEIENANILKKLQMQAN